MENPKPAKTPLIAIVGRPNVGKSTLFNRLIRRWRSIVEDRPGITRDRIYGEFNLMGHAFRLVDTGGLESAPKSVVEKKMSAQAEKGIREADLILFVMDGQDGPTEMDREWIRKLYKIPAPKLYLINKIDTPASDDKAHDFAELALAPLIVFSAEKQRNFSTLGEMILKTLQLEPEEETADEIQARDDANAEALLAEGENWEDYVARIQKRPLKIAILGRPNVGKSTLLNALLDDERSIVDDAPGTTRDPIHSSVFWEGREYVFVDTAGIRKRAKSKERVEKFSIVNALTEMAMADVILLVMDGDEGVADQDAHVAGYAFEKSKPIILLVNKWDLGSVKHAREQVEHDIDFRMAFLNNAPKLYISAKTKKNLGKIFSVIENVKTQMDLHVKTSELNETFAQIVDNHPLPTFRGQNNRMYYASQIGIRPPTFVIMCNEPEHVHFSYRRYLTNALKRAFNMPDIPIRLVFKKRQN